MKNMKTIVTIIVFFMIAGALPAQNPFTGKECILRSEYIYQQGDVNFPGCHASTIEETSNGVIASWFGGTAERNPDVGIWVSLYEKGSWSKPVEVADGVQHKDKRYPTWNPVLFNTGKELLLFFKVGPTPSTWWGELTVSFDEGKTWSLPRRLPEDILGPIKNKPVLLSNGVLLCPSSSEHDGWRVHMEMTGDNGKTWERTAALNEKNIGAIQPSVLIHPSGKIQMVCRSREAEILTSWSTDNGRTWSELKPAGLPNPNSGIDAVTLKDGRHLMVYNHQGSGRNILNVAVSSDGIEWKAAALLENDQKGTEYSYPAIIQTSDGLVHITYTWNRKLIRHAIIDPGRISARSFVNGEWPTE